MGARNAIAAYHRWAGKLSATSMQLLVYMALVSKDSDDDPWFSQGREALARFALGRDGDFGRADARAVERAVHPLLASGAITTARRASARREGNSTALYRLHLMPTAHAPRIPVGDSSDGDGLHAPRKPWVDEPSTNGSRPTETVTDAPRNSSSRPTETVPTTHENRGPKETRGDKEERDEEEIQDVQTASHPPRVAEPGTAPVIPINRPRPVDPMAARRARSRLEGMATLAAKAAKARERIAQTEARIQAQQEAT